VNACYSGLLGNCGARLVHLFGHGHQTLSEIKAECFYANVSMVVATFNHKQKKAYEAMAKHFTIIGQSEPVLNKYTNNFIFSVTYKVEK
jgi:hypothetical protein